MREKYGASIRKTCRLMNTSRTSFLYQSRRDPQTALRMRLKELAGARPRYGYLRLHTMLRREGWLVNRKRIYRLYLEEGLQLRRRRRKRFAVHLRVPLPKASRRDERWAMDFMHDQLAGGKRYRVFTLVDLHTRECLALKADFSLTAADVVAALESLRLRGRKPGAITVDNGSEFSSRLLEGWAFNQGVKLDFIKPGKPVENAYIESFNGQIRYECLNASVLFSLALSPKELVHWQEDYNAARTHGSQWG